MSTIGRKLAIPAYRIRIVDATHGAERTLHDQDFLDGPGTNATFLDYRYGQRTWDNIRVRQKTAEGACWVTFRNESSGNANHKVTEAKPGEPVELHTYNGLTLRVMVDRLPRSSWKLQNGLVFPAPRCVITQEGNGWRVTFMPRQYPCVLTVAVSEKKSKDENLPSFPFPSNPRFARGSFFIRRNQFGAVEGEMLRLGVRGAGLDCVVPLPGAGQMVEVTPDDFQQNGPTQANFLTEQYALEKYSEKAHLIQYG